MNPHAYFFVLADFKPQRYEACVRQPGNKTKSLIKAAFWEQSGSAAASLLGERNGDCEPEGRSQDEASWRCRLVVGGCLSASWRCRLAVSPDHRLGVDSHHAGQGQASRHVRASREGQASRQGRSEASRKGKASREGQASRQGRSEASRKGKASREGQALRRG